MSGNCQAVSHLYRSGYYSKYSLDNYQTTYDSKTKIGVFYSLILTIFEKLVMVKVCSRVSCESRKENNIIGE